MASRTALVLVNGKIQQLQPGDTLAGASAVTTGQAVVDFGPAPGGSLASVAVTGQAGIGAAAAPDAFMLGSDSTADHNDYEHMITPIRLTVSGVTAGTGFTINAACLDLRLSGTFAVRWRY